jgi:hypothetical protein
MTLLDHRIIDVFKLVKHNANIIVNIHRYIMPESDKQISTVGYE